MDRFKPPDRSEEHRDNCVNCGQLKYYHELYYDTNREEYFCSRSCFYEWADTEFEIVSDYYFESNIE